MMKNSKKKNLISFFLCPIMFATKLEEYKKELLAEGREEGILESAKKLKKKGLTDKKISDLLELDIEEIKKL